MGGGSSKHYSVHVSNQEVKHSIQSTECENSLSKSSELSISVNNYKIVKPRVRDEGYLSAMRLVLRNGRFVIPFLDMIQLQGKSDFYEFYEDLEAVKSITAFVKNPRKLELKLNTLLASTKYISNLIHRISCLDSSRSNATVVNDFSESDEFSTSPSSSPSDQDYYINPCIIDCLHPLLSYQLEMISVNAFQKILFKCQDNLLIYLMPEFEIYLSDELSYCPLKNNFGPMKIHSHHHHHHHHHYDDNQNHIQFFDALCRCLATNMHCLEEVDEDVISV